MVYNGLYKNNFLEWLISCFVKDVPSLMSSIYTMNVNSAAKLLATGFLAAMMYTGAASAAPILCQNPANNHMLIDDSLVSACLDAGVGNISGNAGGGNPDPFLTGVGSGYTLLGKDDEGPNPFNVASTQNNGTGTWSFDADAWDDYDTIAIGFKFGTGNNPDEWFIFQVASDVFEGAWQFVNMHFNGAGKPIGGGLSHVNLYGILGTGDDGEDPPQGISEPGMLFLLGAGLMGLAWVRRRHEAAV